jgi:ribose transport system permease protein
MQEVSLIRRIMRNKAIPLLIILIILIVFAMVISSGVLVGKPASSMFSIGFMASANLLQISYRLVIQLVMMCGIAMVLMGGSIDLSASGQAALGAMIFGFILKNIPSLPWGVALILVLLLGAVFGLINTGLVNKLGFPPFIATIGMASVYRGLCNVLTQGDNIQINRDSLFAISNLQMFGGRFSAMFLFGILLIIIYSVILSRTTFGRHIFMTGGNRMAARLSGINTNRIRMILFINNGVLAVLGGFLWSSQVRVASPTAIVSMEPGITIISASILGGVSFGGGTGSLAGPLVAVLLLSVFTNILQILGVQSYWSVFAQGFLLVLALSFDHISQERQRKALLAGTREERQRRALQAGTHGGK